MKLLGSITKDGKHFIASVSRHDYVQLDGAMRDAGQPGLQGSGGYVRGFGTVAWAEVKESFSTLTNNYDKGGSAIWPIKDVRILALNEFPDTDSFEWKKENFIWGTRGIKGDEPFRYINLVDASVGHLQAILDTQVLSEEFEKIIESILKDKLDKESLK